MTPTEQRAAERLVRQQRTEAQERRSRELMGEAQPRKDAPPAPPPAPPIVDAAEIVEFLGDEFDDRTADYTAAE